MKRIVRLTENDLTRIVKRVLKEQRVEIFRKETDIPNLLQEISKKLKKISIEHPNANIYSDVNQNSSDQIGRLNIGGAVDGWGQDTYLQKNIGIRYSTDIEYVFNPIAELDYDDFIFFCKNNEFKKRGYKFKIGTMIQPISLNTNYIDLYYLQKPNSEPSLVIGNDEPVFNGLLLQDLKPIFQDFFNKINELICLKPETGGDNRYAQINNRSNTNNSNIS